MRLLNAHSFLITEYYTHVPPYAILSHTWGQEEVDYVDFVEGRGPEMKGYRKILGCCKQALEDGLEFVWIDTCCIDKRSSSELSEAINSMFKWYQNAAICYAYLEDVENNEDQDVVHHYLAQSYPASFPKSRWFTRGWTLQELLAPPFVVFYALDWTEIGTRSQLREVVAKVTRIDRDFFSSGNLGDYSIAQKMSWAARRQTTRQEDLAYCLLGLFSVNMPLLYGEGPRAFMRLQDEIMKSTDDQSIFAWDAAGLLDWRGMSGDPDGGGGGSSSGGLKNPGGAPSSEAAVAAAAAGHGPPGGLLAPSPSYFYNSNYIVRCETDEGGVPYSITNQGIKISLPFIDSTSHFEIPFVPYQGMRYTGGSSEVKLAMTPSGSFAVLNCQSINERGAQLGIMLDRQGGNASGEGLYARTDHSLGLISVPKSTIREHATRRSLLIQANNQFDDGSLWAGGRQGRLVLISPFKGPAANFKLKEVTRSPAAMDRDGGAGVPWNMQEDGGISLRIRNTTSYQGTLVNLTFEEEGEEGEDEGDENEDNDQNMEQEGEKDDNKDGDDDDDDDDIDERNGPRRRRRSYRPRHRHCFTLIIEALGTPGRENSVHIRLQPNCENQEARQRQARISSWWHTEKRKWKQSGVMSGADSDQSPTLYEQLTGRLGEKMHLGVKLKEADHASRVFLFASMCPKPPSVPPSITGSSSSWTYPSSSSSHNKPNKVVKKKSSSSSKKDGGGGSRWGGGIGGEGGARRRGSLWQLHGDDVDDKLTPETKVNTSALAQAEARLLDLIKAR